MSTRCYDTDLNDAAWAWIAPYLPAARPGGRSRTTNLRAVLKRDLLPAANRLPMAPATPLCSRARAPFTITFVPGKRRASWPNCNRRFMSRRASSRGRLPCPSVVILEESVGQDHRARRHPWFRWAQTGQRAQTPPARGHPGDGGGPSGRNRQCVGPTRGGAAACRLTIRLPRGSGR